MTTGKLVKKTPKYINISSAPDSPQDGSGML